MLKRTELLQDVMMFDFAVTDVSLFLDTHPHDQNAFQYYQEANQRLKQATELYTKQFGPLNNRTIAGDCYDYVNAPWPWEGEKSCGCMKNDCNFQ